MPTAPWEDLIGEIFRRDEPPRWLILFAGPEIYLLDRTKWGYGQYLLFDLDELFGRRERETLRATRRCWPATRLPRRRHAPARHTGREQPQACLWRVAATSSIGVRRAVELLANECVWYQRNVAQQALFQDETWRAG